MSYKASDEVRQKSQHCSDQDKKLCGNTEDDDDSVK